MSSSWQRRRIFWQEFRQSFQSTGALLPSGRRLCRALARHTAAGNQPRRLLEVGPGTGVVTDHIIAGMGPSDTLDLVELNPAFVDELRRRLETDDAWRSVAGRVTIVHAPIEEVDPNQQYDAVVSGLPLNNFSSDLATRILRRLRDLTATSATLSFFEYVAIRKFKSLASRRAERLRLAGVERAIGEALNAWAFDRQCVLSNIPPAWVHHLRFDRPAPFQSAGRLRGD
ncbi:MAG: methyltransferase domain-containing protein [Planctomycetota bacterium]